MSGSGERIVFVHARPGDESWLTGGTIARLCADHSRLVVLYEADAADGAAEAALAELGAQSWYELPAPAVPGAESDDRATAQAVADSIDDEHATAVVIGVVTERVRAAATEAAHAAGIPVFVATRVSAMVGQRLIAIDVSDHVDQKLHALEHYPERWRVIDRVLVRPDGSEAVGGAEAVGGTETYLRIDAPRRVNVTSERVPAASRAVSSLIGLLIGVTFGVLGTIGHLSTLSIGGLVVPIGLAIALVAVAALLVGLRLVLGDRLVVGVTAAGLLLTVFLLSLRGSGGSVLVPAGLPGTLWTVVPALVAGLVLAWPKIPPHR